MHELGRLITERMEAERLTYDAVAAAGDIPKGTVWAIVHRDLAAPPRIKTIERLAKGLGLPVEVVSEAAARSTGYWKQEVETSDPNVRIIVQAAEQLSEEDRASLAAMATAFLKQAKKRNTN